LALKLLWQFQLFSSKLANCLGSCWAFIFSNFSRKQQKAFHIGET
jgi:hypothetical protein